MISISGFTVLPAGERRLHEAERRGEDGFGSTLPLHDLSTDDGVTIRVYLVGPVSKGGRDQRLAYYDIRIGGRV